MEGTPPDERRYSNEYLARAFDTATEIAHAADRGGYDIFWLAEHHFQPEGYECIPNLPLLSVHLAHLTTRVKFGAAFNIVPMWHPLRLAEDFATADILTKGRVIFGVGRGYHTREGETLGTPMVDQDANRELFEEQVEIILKAFNQDSFSHQGKHYTIPPRVPYRTYELEEITLVPRPITRPVEIWQAIVSGNRRGLDFMARNQIKGILLWSDETGDQLVRMYQEACAARGQELQLGENLCLGFFVHLDDSREKAMRAATPFFEEYMKFFAPLGFIRGITDEQMRRLQTRLAASTPGLPTIRTGTDQHSWLCGTPEDVIAQLKEFEDRYPGLDSVIVRSSIGTPKTTMIEQLDWFAKEVIPAFRC